ncbi:MAG: 2-amino-4-hydroxy-6-hydroxymethyldihydropteridine diphosphokinase, partial [Akkermansia sp.]|nr:2-amino-4-hydroxy-6-hydroxymethyldihydropteridine diphosphokinase [Akkermansia sp.]
IDILYYGELQSNTPELILPHPRAHEREFVLRPLCDIDPLLVLPGQQATVQELLAAIPHDNAVALYPL